MMIMIVIIMMLYMGQYYHEGVALGVFVIPAALCPYYLMHVT